MSDFPERERDSKFVVVLHDSYGIFNCYYLHDARQCDYLSNYMYVGGAGCSGMLVLCMGICRLIVCVVV